MNYPVPEEYRKACLVLLKETDYAVLPDVQLVLTNKADILTFRNKIRNEYLGLSTLYGGIELLPEVPKAVWGEKLPD
jgi:hypothetical protein|tara:strand:+ start:338 stop:568 length:231 start_codon:yes stop_codon:yes gene_type:complete